MYKNIRTTRGYTYHYLSVKPQADKPTLLFMHGFPDTSHGWNRQIDYFRSRGYGLIVPDMLGFGGTDKPTDPAAFLCTAVAQDMIDILDAEEVPKVYAVGHDWGSTISTILSIKHSDRFIGFAYITVPYSPPEKLPPLDEILRSQMDMFGHPIVGYWTFFTKEDAASKMEEHLDSLLDVVYAADPEIWKTLINIPGELEPFVVEGRRLPSANYFPTGSREQLKDSLAQGGLTSPLNWYKSVVQGVNDAIIDGLKPEDLMIKKPTFFALAKLDYVAIEPYARGCMEKHTPAHLLTMIPYNTGHWVHMEEPSKFNADLEKWMETAPDTD
ncbi:Alpha/Beta hydrolase protein [Scleroderma citrinum]